MPSASRCGSPGNFCSDPRGPGGSTNVRSSFKSESVAYFQQVIGGLKDGGCDAVVLGCTEIPLLIDQSHTSIPVFDTTALHAAAAVELALR